MRSRLLLPGALLAALIAGCGASTKTTTVVVSSTPTTSTTPTSTSSSPVTTTQSTSTPAQPVFFAGVVSPGKQRPRTLELTGDGTLFVGGVQWSSWGGPEALGSGNAEYHGCTPNCASAPVHMALVSIRLSNIRVCGGRRYYSGLTLTLNSGKLLENQYVQRSWSPC